MKNKRVLVVGSLAFDVMFSIPSDFRQSIPLKEGKIDHFNATYVANGKSQHPGGTAGNIAAWMGYENNHVSVFSAWGKDLDDEGYETTLKKLGHDLRGSVGDYTAHCYNVSDPEHQQLVIWQPNHYEANQTQSLAAFYSHEELEAFEIVIFSAGTPESILKHMLEFRAVNNTAKIIFDPGQVSPFFLAENFVACVALSNIVIGNKAESEHFESYMKASWPATITKIITLGDQGVEFYAPGQDSIAIAAAKVAAVIETTGAGDAFRAGLIGGLLEGLSLENSLDRALILGAKSVQLPAPQPKFSAHCLRGQ